MRNGGYSGAVAEFRLYTPAEAVRTARWPPETESARSALRGSKNRHKRDPGVSRRGRSGMKQARPSEQDGRTDAYVVTVQYLVLTMVSRRANGGSAGWAGGLAGHRLPSHHQYSSPDDERAVHERDGPLQP
nr:hypothetical protein CFP56_23924 [Quercus suber]